MERERETHPLSQLRADALRAARALASEARWAEARAYYLNALGAHAELFDQTLLQSDRFNLLAEMNSLQEEAAYASARTGDVQGAALVLELGRARILGGAWVRDRLFGPALAEFDPALAAEYARAAARLAEFERRERDIIRDAAPGEDTSGALGALRVEVGEAAGAMARLLEDARQHLDYDEYRAVKAFEHIETVVREGSTLVYVATTVFGSFAIVAAAAAGRGVSYEVCWMDKFVQAHLLQPVSVLTEEMNIILWTVGSSLRAASVLSQLERGGDWLDVITQLENVLFYVGAGLTAPLARFLTEKGMKDIVLVPYGELAQTPLHIAPFRHGDEVVSLIDLFDLRLAPSAAILEMCRRAAARSAGSQGICTVIRSPELRGAAYESEHLESLWPPERFRALTADEADREAVRESMSGARHIVLSCHGYFQYWDQLSSGFVAGGKKLFDLRDMLNEELLPECRLALAPACQSGFEDSPTTLDECVSLSLGLICTGAAGVLGSQWNVDDLVSAIFVTRFHEEMFSAHEAERERRPWVVFSRVQRWLKNVSADELNRYAQSVPTLAALLADYFEEYGPTALSGIYATREKRSEEVERLMTVNNEGRATTGAPDHYGDGVKMRPWFWGAFLYVGA